MRLRGVGQTAGRHQSVLKVLESNIRHHGCSNNTAVRVCAALCIALIRALYWESMNEANPKSAAELELKRLEKRLENLMVAVTPTKEENPAFRQGPETPPPQAADRRTHDLLGA